MDDFEKTKKKLLKTPEFKKIHEESRLEFEIARAIIHARIAKGLTQKQLAKRLHTGQSAISRVERANTTPSISFLKKLAVALNTTLSVQFK